MAGEFDNTTEPTVAEEVATSETLPTHLSSDLPKPQILENEPDDHITSQQKSVTTAEEVAAEKIEVNTNENLESE